MPDFPTVGEIPRKHHTVFRQNGDSLHREELIGEDGSVGDTSSSTGDT